MGDVEVGRWGVKMGNGVRDGGEGEDVEMREYACLCVEM